MKNGAPSLFALLTVLIGAACSDDETSSGGGGGVLGAGGSGAGGAPVGGGAEGGQGGAGGSEPDVPPGLVVYLTGDPTDASVSPSGPGLVLMGGGLDVDEAFQWMSSLAAGGDAVVLRTSGGDGYNAYLYEDIGGFDSVETLLVTSQALANSSYVASRLAGAEVIFMAGGDQAEYLLAWKGTRVEEEVEAAWARGALIGGTSAGCAVLGSFAFSALQGTVYSDEALADPYNQYMTFESEFLDVPVLDGVITDTHFHERDRMGRLLAFVARPIADGAATSMVGLGVDEATALLLDGAGAGAVVGDGSVYVVRSTATVTQCVPGAPLEIGGFDLARLGDGDTVVLPSGATSVAGTTIGASGGVTVPLDPY